MSIRSPDFAGHVSATFVAYFVLKWGIRFVDGNETPNVWLPVLKASKTCKKKKKKKKKVFDAQFPLHFSEVLREFVTLKSQTFVLFLALRCDCHSRRGTLGVHLLRSPTIQ
jgi:hypothetical protein